MADAITSLISVDQNRSLEPPAGTVSSLSLLPVSSVPIAPAGSSGKQLPRFLGAPGSRGEPELGVGARQPFLPHGMWGRGLCRHPAGPADHPLPQVKASEVACHGTRPPLDQAATGRHGVAPFKTQRGQPTASRCKTLGRGVVGACSLVGEQASKPGAFSPVCVVL